MGDRRISGFTPCVNFEGLLSNENSTSVAMIQGIDLKKGKEVINIYKKIFPGGRYLKKSNVTVYIFDFLLLMTVAFGIMNTNNLSVSKHSMEPGGDVLHRQQSR